MRIFICVDDTDDLTKSTSTGKISELIARSLVDTGGTLIKGVTRHQLLLHADIDYTSHNSSMCMELQIDDPNLSSIQANAEDILRKNMAETSAPGLCFCISEELNDPDSLMAFGRRAQKEILTKQEAYALAEKIGGTTLKEYGGTGMGIIGALAGVGLRLSGCDGTFRGGKDNIYEGQTLTVKELLGHIDIQQVLNFNGEPLDETTEITLKDQLKLAHLDHKRTLIAKQKNGKYFACKKKELYDGNNKLNTWHTTCKYFVEDNDIDEQYDDTSRACYNCLYRRWTANGFICIKPNQE